MHTLELLHILRTNPHTARYATGVYARDRLPKRIRRPLAIIINTDESNEAGTHWVSIYIDKSGRGVYFDSYGLPPYYPEFRKFLKKNTSSYTYNKKRIQGQDGPCGQYCLYFLMCMLRKKPLQFKYSLDANDRWIKEWIKTLF